MYKRLQTLHLTVSHSSLIHLLERAGKNFDEEVLKWKDGIASTLDTSNEIVSFKFLVVICKIPIAANPGNPLV